MSKPNYYSRQPITAVPPPSGQQTLILDGFGVDKYALTNTHIQRLREVAKAIFDKLNEPVRVVSLLIAGHADPSGTEIHNLGLGLNRANAVAQCLVAELKKLLGKNERGLQLEIQLISSGETQLASPYDNARNRRVEVNWAFDPLYTPPPPPPPGYGRGRPGHGHPHKPEYGRGTKPPMGRPKPPVRKEMETSVLDEILNGTGEW